MGKSGKTTINIKLNWDNQDPTFTAKKKVEVTGIRLTQHPHSKQLDAIFNFLTNLMVTGMTLS